MAVFTKYIFVTPESCEALLHYVMLAHKPSHLYFQTLQVYGLFDYCKLLGYLLHFL
jgi:hypothetical protein